MLAGPGCHSTASSCQSDGYRADSTAAGWTGGAAAARGRSRPWMELHAARPAGSDRPYVHVSLPAAAAPVISQVMFMTGGSERSAVNRAPPSAAAVEPSCSVWNLGWRDRLARPADIARPCSCGSSVVSWPAGRFGGARASWPQIAPLDNPNWSGSGADRLPPTQRGRLPARQRVSRRVGDRRADDIVSDSQRVTAGDWRADCLHMCRQLIQVRRQATFQR